MSQHLSAPRVQIESAPKMKPWVISKLAYKAGPTDKAELDLYQAICAHIDDAGNCFPGERRLGEFIRRGERTVRRVLERLTDTDGGRQEPWVWVKRGRRQNQEYTLNLKKLCDAAVAGPYKLEDAEQAFVAQFRPDILRSNLAGLKPVVQIKTGQNVHQDRTFSTLRPDISGTPIEKRVETLEPNNTLVLTAPEPDVPSGAGKVVTMPQVPAADSAKVQDEEDKKTVEHLFGYYLDRLERKSKLYLLNSERMKKGLQALRECRKRFGDDEKAQIAMAAAIDSLANNDFMRGKNDRNRRYIDWIDHLFKDSTTMEKRWQEGGFDPDV